MFFEGERERGFREGSVDEGERDGYNVEGILEGTFCTFLDTLEGENGGFLDFAPTLPSSF